MAHLYYSIAPDVVAFSTRRQGGVSQGAYAGFNVNPFYGDRPDAVLANRQALAAELDIAPDRLVIPRQVHGTAVAMVDAPAVPDGVDALVTRTPGLCVCVSTADCIPVLLYDAYTRTVAAVHAGWRGTVADIVGCTLDFMRRHCGTLPQNVQAVLGPGIGLQAFEVGDEVYAEFLRSGFPMEQISLREEKWHIDLWEANRWLLGRRGVTRVALSGICTYQHADEFFSARKFGLHSGRILNGILLKEVQKN